MSEYTEHRALITLARKNLDTYPELRWLITIPSEIGGYRARFRPLMAKGAPDLWLPVRRLGFAGLVIELKAGKNKPTKEQKECLAFVEEQRYLACWTTGHSAAWELVQKYLDEGEILITEKKEYRMNF